MGQSKEELGKVFKKMAFVNDNTPGNERTYNPETGAELKFVSRTPMRGLYNYVFGFEGEEIELEAIRNPDDDSRKGWNPDIHWVFSKLRLPEHMEDRREEIAEMVRQAFEAHGSSYNRERYNKVTAEYRPL